MKSSTIKYAIAILALAISLPAMGAELEFPERGSGGASFEFLWPRDPGRPGADLVRLEAEDTGSGRPIKPMGVSSDTRVYNLLGPGGDVVAVTTVYRMPNNDGFEAMVFSTELKKAITAPTGKFETTHFAFPAFTPPATHKRTLCFIETAFAPPSDKPVAATGPAAAYSDDLEVMIISPLDHFLVAINSPENGSWRSGFEGLIEEVPRGTVHTVLAVSGQGMNATFEKWGELLRGWHGHEKQEPYADVGIGWLGYYTDNGAYYYYKTAPGMNEHDTLMAVRQEAIERDIPYRYFQIDSWWYPKRTTNTILSAFRGGALLWEPIPEKFPEGLGVFREELGLPLVAHNRWYDEDSPYCERYKCVYGHGSKKPALPIEDAFWDEIMDNAASYGVEVYEQDWLVTQMDMIPWLRSGLGNAESWFNAMATKARERDLTMQLCMASPGFFLQQVKFDHVTHVRTSGDYLAGGPKTYWWPKFHQTSMLAWATGMYPWKDVHMTSGGQRLFRGEKWPLEETLIANLSAGPVGPGDKLGAAGREIIMRTCRDDGMLLKPDRPATPIEKMFVDNDKPWIVTTESEHSIGATRYVAAFNLWPLGMRDPEVGLSELGAEGDYAIVNWRTREVLLDADKIGFGKMPKNDAFYYVLCPVQPNGMFMIGEAGKFVTMSKARFPRVDYRDGRLYAEVAGAPGERVTVMIYSPVAPSLIRGVEPPCEAKAGVMEISVTIPDSGIATISVE